MHEMRGLGGFQGKANCLEMIVIILNLTHLMTMPQAAGKKCQWK